MWEGTRTAAMFVGDTVIHDGESYVVIGLTPMSVTPALVELRDHRGAASFWVERRLVTEMLRPDPTRAQATLPRDDSWPAQLRREWDRQEGDRRGYARDLPLTAEEE